MERLSSPATGHDSVAPAYERHRPEETVLYRVVQMELESFLACVRDRPLPRFVEREFRGFLECGILAHGFLRVHCDACGREKLHPWVISDSNGLEVLKTERPRRERSR